MRNIYLFVVLFLAISCHSNLPLNSSINENVVIEDSLYKNKKTEKIISPYREVMEAEMNVAIGYLLNDLPKDRSAIETDLGNLVADIVFTSVFNNIKTMDKEVKELNTFCLINKGGLRTSLFSGVINKKDIYQLMPFDNEIVILKIAPQRVKKMLNYLFLVKGQPISNAKILLSSDNGRLFIGEEENSLEKPLYIITSDYLAKGGDKMSFLLEPEQYFQTGILIRDAILDYFVKNDTVDGISNRKNRIHFVK